MKHETQLAKVQSNSTNYSTDLKSHYTSQVTLYITICKLQVALHET